MKYDAKKVLRNLKEKMIEEQIKTISADLDSSNNLTIAVALKVQCDESVQKVKKFLEDEDPKVKVESIKVLLNLGENVDEKIVTEIIENTKLPFEIRTAALKIFVMHFKDSLPLLKKMAESTYSKMNSVAISLMGKFPCDEVWKSLETVILNDSFPSETIQSALKSASNTCRERKELEEMAIKYVNYPSKSLKITALRVLMSVESQNVEGIIEEFLEGKDRNLKLSVVPFVEEYPSKNNVEVLLESLEDDDEEMMEKSLKVLGRLKTKDERIRNGLFDHTVGVRIQSLKALVSSGDSGLEELMLSAVTMSAL